MPETISSILDLEERVLFTPGTSAETENANEADLDEKIRNALEIYKERAENLNGLAEVGNSLGDMIIRKLETLDYASKSIEEMRESSEELNDLHSVLHEFLGEKKQILTNGVFAEYCSLYCFDSLGYPTYYSEKDDDMKGKVDFWVDTEADETNVLAIQVKVLNSRDLEYGFDPQNRIFLINNEEDVEQLIEVHSGAIRSEALFRENAKKMLEYTSQYENVQVVYLILPTPTGENAVFNVRSGSPNTSLANELYTELENKFLYPDSEVK